ncbi:sulfurtransferase [Denitrobaculum tricleocarpae]|uniref:Sulfurtransferase n=1 Tax=Denitrobaculum tricleocarpae TaxID=2591009 RepID=A0A545TMV4_9PROT|nr:sulfurtransferase [Denitrobaculum tricleocarpae]TQV78567.1 sulfurtransferase [Denitrobaculum tricleocarpae]
MDSSSLISADELNGVLGREKLRVFDVRGTWQTPARALHDDYLAGHIPGAVFVDWTKQFLDQGQAVGLAPVCDQEAAAADFKSLGVNEGDLCILYDDYSHMLAGRVWWAMRHWGFENLRVLNGGWSHWKAQGFPVSTDVPNVPEGSFTPRLNSGLRVSLNELQERMAQACHMDARGPVSYAGKPEDPRTGHIPGALHVHFKELLDEDTGLFLESDALEKVFDRLAPEWRTRPVIASCGSGYAGTVPMLALSGLGVDSSLYDGSFSEWKQEPSRPVEQS